MGQYKNPIFIDTVDKVVSTAKKYGKYSGIQGMIPGALEGYINKGMQVNLYSNEVTMLLASTSAVKEIKTYELNK